MDKLQKKHIKIIHVIKDDKFFDSRPTFYDKLENVKNSYFLYSREKKYSFKYIKKTEKVTLFHDYIKYVKAIREADIVLFYSLLRIDYLTLCLTSSKQKVIWWAWGYDIYDTLKGMPPLVRLELYKPLTKAYLNKHKKVGLLIKIKMVVMGALLQMLRCIGLPKVDFMIPCLPIDYELLKNNCSYFKALPFPSGIIKGNPEFVYKERSGNILIGNSLTYTNNHLDIIYRLKNICLPNDNKYIFPINYGTAYNGGTDLMQTGDSLRNQVLWLKSFMDKKEYFKLLASVSHAIFGVIRQQALGNIYYCLRTGIKVFLYNDSIVAQQLKRDGYIFYSIDNDLTEESLTVPLSKEQALHNYNIYLTRYNGRMVDDVQNALKSVINSDNV